MCLQEAVFVSGLRESLIVVRQAAMLELRTGGNTRLSKKVPTLLHLITHSLIHSLTNFQ